MTAIFSPQIARRILQPLRASLYFGIIFASAQSTALEYSVQLNSQIEHDSNSTRSDPESSDVRTTLGTTIELAAQRRAVDVSANYDIDYAHYARDTINENLQSSGGAKLLWRAIDQILLWDTTHNIAQITANQRNDPNKPTNVVDTDDNTRTRQEFATGPTLSLPFGDLDTLTLSARYSQIFFSAAENRDLATPDPDSKNTNAEISWGHLLSPTSSLNVDYQYSEASRDDSLKVQRLETINAGYSKQLRASNYSLQLGNTKVKTANIRNSESIFYSAVYGADFGSQSLYISASRQRSETTTSTAAAGDEVLIIEGLSTSFNLENFEIEGTVDSKTYDAKYQSSAFCSRCNYSVGINLTQNSYDTVPDDDAKALTANFTHRINRQLNLTLTGRHIRRHFDSTRSNTDTTTSDLVLGWNPNTNAGINVGFTYGTRRGDLITDNEYDYASAFISFSYLLFANE